VYKNPIRTLLNYSYSAVWHKRYSAFFFFRFFLSVFLIFPRDYQFLRPYSAEWSAELWKRTGKIIQWTLTSQMQYSVRTFSAKITKNWKLSGYPVLRPTLY
jgi:hypothetical protein